MCVNNQMPILDIRNCKRYCLLWQMQVFQLGLSRGCSTALLA